MQGPYDQFLLFGDSITQQSCSQADGFAFSPALQDAFIRRLDVINRGFSGYNTANAVLALPGFMPKPEQARLRFMTVFFGANDACLPGSATGQHVPLNEYKKNLRDILDHPSVVAQKPRLILLTPPPVNEYQLEVAELLRGYKDRLRTAEHTKEYADACRQVGAEAGVAVLDVWSIFMAKAGWREGEPLIGSKKLARNEVLEKLLVDGLHFRPDAYRLLYDSMMDLIQNEWPDQAPDSLRFIFQHWQEAPK
ncbi:MAG: hypothetical protein ALECFALPRED_002790 [Alectoria fallacina]|uniref:SGNH hydrolase-type esterase domain-containing protein n=1 Tax=Alectoria fallacina TaxID=1903189 RepID=A0A8H3FEK0_9LECA|nr:MAG: hypothetical protein ALECFALPRED_002790 [Alectoria fallacina]